MNEYRITRPELYGPGTIGHTDLSARQGHYATAETPEEAMQIVRERMEFPRPNERLDCQLWKMNVPVLCLAALGGRIPEHLLNRTVAELSAMPTLESGHFDNLKMEVETGGSNIQQGDLWRVWLSRCTVADGEPYDNKVTIEHLQDGRWTVVHTYEAK